MMPDPSSNTHIRLPDQKSLQKIIKHLFTTTDQIDRVKFFGWLLSEKSHVQHQCNLAISSAVGVTPQTAYNWTSGLTECGKAGELYALCRAGFPTELDMARAFGEFINRDLIKEALG